MDIEFHLKNKKYLLGNGTEIHRHIKNILTIADIGFDKELLITRCLSFGCQIEKEESHTNNTYLELPETEQILSIHWGLADGDGSAEISLYALTNYDEINNKDFTESEIIESRKEFDGTFEELVADISSKIGNPDSQGERDKNYKFVIWKGKKAYLILLQRNGDANYGFSSEIDLIIESTLNF
jgi:hypothetical protein